MVFSNEHTQAIWCMLRISNSKAFLGMPLPNSKPGHPDHDLMNLTARLWYPLGGTPCRPNKLLLDISNTLVNNNFNFVVPKLVQSYWIYPKIKLRALCISASNGLYRKWGVIIVWYGYSHYQKEGNQWKFMNLRINICL